MMNIVIQINPHPDGVRCGECRGYDNYDAGANKWLCPWSIDSKEDRRGTVECVRGPECLAAEQKLKRLVEAGKVIHDGCPTINEVEEWDAALAALETR